MKSNDAIETLKIEFPYELHQVMAPNGALVWIQRGVNPDNIFDDKRRSDWPYSKILADLICQQIVEGASLTQVCKTTGFPPYAVVCRWRVEHSEFKEMLEQSYQDRAELHMEQILDLVKEIDCGENRKKLRLKFQALKWCASLKKIKAGTADYSLIINS